MSLARKLQLRNGQMLRVVNAPKDVDLDDVSPTSAASAEAVLAFVATSGEIREHAEPALAAARKDQLAWIAYPKAGQLGTDLNRDLLWKRLEGSGVRPVRQVSIDDVWSAMRFRPAE